MSQPPPLPDPADDERAIATAHDVARLAGVSQSAVSRAFTSGASISPRMRQKVVEASDRLGYRPNLLARSLITRRSNIVGVGMGNVENLFFPLALDKLSSRLAQRGLQLLLFTAEANAQVDRQIEELLRYRVDAIVLLSAVMSSRLAGECRKAGIPVILFNRTARHSASMFSVTGDNVGGAHAIGRYLLEAGYRRMAFMAGYEDSSTSRARETGFREFLAGQGVAAPIRATGEFTQAGAIRAARELLSRRKRPDVIFCANDQMALATIEIARHEFGLDVGRDIGVVGFDDIPMAAWPSFALTTYSQPIDAMADQAAQFIARLDQPPRERHAIVAGDLMIRASTRPLGG